MKSIIRIFNMIWALKPFILIFFIIYIFVWALTGNISSKISAIPNNTATNNPEKTSTSKQIFDTKQTKSAHKIMENAKHLANIFEESGTLVVEFNQYLFPEDINKRLQFVRAVANADFVITGESRSIYYYNPGGKQIAKADTTNGIRLVD
jgi:sensor histidine kinase regulating citrate/malate metabolism